MTFAWAGEGEDIAVSDPEQTPRSPPTCGRFAPSCAEDGRDVDPSVESR